MCNEEFPLSRWGEGRDDFMGNAEQIKYGVESSANLKTRREPYESWRVGWVSDARRVTNYLLSHKDSLAYDVGGDDNFA